MQTYRLTKSTASVLQVLLDSSEGRPAWGLSICRDADLGPSTVYPILDRLEERGWVSARMEVGPHPGRPPRRFYELTDRGRQLANEALEKRKDYMSRWARKG
ncbi:PadR family transcriptional regulator [Streptomyces sp. NPDC058947]|uniref:PadR family transcriptional regulator n=1 Tax=Streptomyces sp. NPDC058947 TaxID=3346675 RepID=UPI00367F35CA